MTSAIPEVLAALLYGLKLARVILQRGKDPLERSARVERAKEAFRSCRQLARENRRRLSEIALRLPEYATGRQVFEFAPLLARPSWVCGAPLRLSPPDSVLQDDDERFVTTFLSDVGTWESPTTRLSRAGYHEIVRRTFAKIDLEFPGKASLHAAVKSIEDPPENLFVSRPSYSLLAVEASSTVGANEQVRLKFGRAAYFDHIDTGELMVFELAMALALDEPIRDTPELQARLPTLMSKLPVRTFLGEWDQLATRPSLAGVNMACIFVDHHTGDAFVPLLTRRKNLGTAAQIQHVIPAGEFQPTTGTEQAFRNHCTLWQTLLREFAEEILGDEEAASDRRDMRELARGECISACLELLRAGQWQTFYLGTALDPATLKPEIMLCSVIDLHWLRAKLSHRFPDGILRSENEEGQIDRCESGWGWRLSKDRLLEYARSETVLPAGAGCLELMHRHFEYFDEAIREMHRSFGPRPGS